MPYELLIKIGGVYHLICACLHIFFPKMLRWDAHLKELAPDSKLVIKQSLHILNICVLLFWLILAYIPFFYSRELLTTGIGKAFLTAIVIFWVARIFILQPVFIGVKTRESWQMIVFFMFGFVLFLLP